ncbi:MAG: AAC(3) family N-acetyltransferase [Bacteroidota bacterium]|nr:AAC(3) family N-acetyltransferase [Bacteroidota bacterium]
MDLKVKIFSLLKKYAPVIITVGKRLKKTLKRNALETKRRNQEVISREQLVADFKSLGLQEGDNVIVHSSLSKMGYVDGGAATFCEALISVIGATGTLMAPCFAHDTFSKYYLDKNPVFDVLNSPSKAGAVTEYLRKIKGAKRSLHPTDSVCAVGPLADFFTNSHFGQPTPYNEFSPYYKLTNYKGKILNIGVPLNTSCTNLHTLEDAVDFKFPVYHEKIMEASLIDEKGNLQKMKTKVHDPSFSEKRKPDDLLPLFEKEGIVKKGRVGEAAATMIDAKGLLDVMIDQYQKNGVTMYTPHGS